MKGKECSPRSDLKFYYLVFILVCCTAQIALAVAKDTLDVKPAAVPSITVTQTTPTAGNDDPVAKMRKNCKDIQAKRESDCQSTKPKLSDSLGSYTCKNKKLDPKYHLTTETTSPLEKKVSCISESAVVKKTKSEACGNTKDSKSAADKNSCSNGTVRMPNDIGVTPERAKSAGIKCFFEDESTTLSGSKKKYVTICNDDQEAFKKLAQPVVLASAGTVMNDATKVAGNIPQAPTTPSPQAVVKENVIPVSTARVPEPQAVAREQSVSQQSPATVREQTREQPTAPQPQATVREQVRE